MRPPYQRLADALTERLQVISDRELRETDPAAHLARLQAASERIAQIQTQLPADIDPQLDHFLKRCSYDKALALLKQM